MKASDKQVDGNHYKGLAIQPTEFIAKNKIPFIEGNIIKYACRWREKGGIKDLEKIKHYVDLLIEYESHDEILTLSETVKIQNAAAKEMNKAYLYSFWQDWEKRG